VAPSVDVLWDNQTVFVEGASVVIFKFNQVEPNIQGTRNRFKACGGIRMQLLFYN
jgi:hypothetical protein